MSFKRVDGLYALMARLPVRIGYAGKIFLAAFVPAQIPIVTLIVLGRLGAGPAVKILAAVISSLFAGFLMAWAIYALLRPLRIARTKLHHLVEARQGQINLDDAIDTASVLVSDVDRVVNYVADVDESFRLLKEASLLDPVTLIPNRLFCGPRLEQDLARSRRDTVPLTLAFIDVDNLKEINDHYGHLAGDAALQHVARTISGVVRAGDWTARWGGDEFVICFWKADQTRAEIVCARIFAALRATPAQYERFVIPVSVSLGISQATREDDATKLLEKADLALLQAKKVGRDQMVLFEVS